jgi:hypothetical protein
MIKIGYFNQNMYLNVFLRLKVRPLGALRERWKRTRPRKRTSAPMVRVSARSGCWSEQRDAAQAEGQAAARPKILLFTHRNKSII